MKEQDQEKNFKDILRQKAVGFYMEPSDDVWANVKISLREDKRRRRFLWLWPVAIAMLIGSGTLGWLLSSYNDHKGVRTDTQTTLTTTDAEKRTNNTTSDNEQLSEESDRKTTEVFTASSAVKNNAVKRGAIKEEPFPASSSKNNFSPENRNALIVSEKDVLPTDEIIFHDTIALFAKTDAVENSNIEKPVTGAMDQSSTRADSIPQSATVDAAGSKEEIPSGTAAVLVETNHKTGRFCLQAEVMPLISYRSLSIKSSMNTNKTVTDLADSLTVLANNNSKPVAGYATGIRGSYRFSEKWGITAALHFSNTGYHLSAPPGILADNFVSTGSSDVDSSWDYPGGIQGSSNGSPAFYIYQPGYGYEFEERFKGLDLSAQLEWIFWRKNKNELSAAAGVGISHLLQYKSIRTPNEMLALNTSSGNMMPFEPWSKYGMLTMASVDYRRILSKHFSLSAGLSFTYHLTNSLGADFYSVEHPYWLGTNIGVGYCF
jgi:hypothetical protein